MTIAVDGTLVLCVVVLLLALAYRAERRRRSDYHNRNTAHATADHGR